MSALCKNTHGESKINSLCNPTVITDSDMGAQIRQIYERGAKKKKNSPPQLTGS